MGGVDVGLGKYVGGRERRGRGFQSISVCKESECVYVCEGRAC